jgi:hypothetical protein
MICSPVKRLGFMSIPQRVMDSTHSGGDCGAQVTRTRITNGKELLPGIDGRSLWARRFRDVLALHLSDLGGQFAA